MVCKTNVFSNKTKAPNKQTHTKIKFLSVNDLERFNIKHDN